MTKRGVAPDMISYSTVIHACLQSQKKDRAAHWLNEMKGSGLTPSSFNYRTVIQAFSREGCTAQATRYLREALADYVDVGDYCIGGVIAANLRAGELEKAEEFLPAMADLNGEKARSFCQSIANAWSRWGDRARADAVW